MSYELLSSRRTSIAKHLCLNASLDNFSDQGPADCPALPTKIFGTFRIHDGGYLCRVPFDTLRIIVFWDLYWGHPIWKSTIRKRNYGTASAITSRSPKPDSGPSSSLPLRLCGRCHKPLTLTVKSKSAPEGSNTLNSRRLGLIRSV